MNRRHPVVIPPHDGKPGLCCWCGTALTGRKIRWCGTECVHEYQIAKGDQGRARELLWKRDAGRCALCTTTPDERELVGDSGYWEADHAVPIVEGGALALSNLRTLCIACHRAETAALRARMSKARRSEGKTTA